MLLPFCALGTELLLRSWVERIPFVLFFFVVAITSSVGGWGPGLVSVAISGLCGWLLLSTSPAPDHQAGALVSALLFVPVAFVIATFGALIRTGFRERERAALQLAEAVRLRDQFISAASHELRTPLTSLALVAQQLARRTHGSTTPEPGVLRLVDSLQWQASRLTLLVNNLLSVPGIGTGRMHLDLEEVDLARLVREVVEQFEDEFARIGSTVTLEAEEPIVGRWDRLRLDQILTNLLSNAMKYGSGSPIAVAVRLELNAAILTVSDGGIGIAKEDQDQIFDRFARGAHGNAPGGFGIGLWLVRESATALGGAVRVESAPHQGATFTVVLPVSNSSGRP